MKNFIFALALVIPLLLAGTAHAQTAPAVAPSVFDTQNTLPLAGKKEYVQDSLGATLTRLSLAYTRTQLADDRLNANGIVNTAADAALLSARTSIVAAKIGLDTFAALPLDATILRNQSVAIENNLRSARSSLIISVTALKTALTADTQ